MEVAVVYLILATFMVNFVSIDAQCDSHQYDIKTQGIPDAGPAPLQAWQGVPFFPELEPSNRKYFRVKSGTDVVLYLLPRSQIQHEVTDLYYQIVLEQNGVTTISRSNVEKGNVPSANLLSSSDYVDLWVDVIKDGTAGTIHVGRKNGGELASWRDTTIIDVNYILVQKFDDPDGDSALWEFCDGTLKLLSQNQSPAASKTVVASHLDNDGTPYRSDGLAGNAIDGKTNEGLFDDEYCQALDHHRAGAGFEEFGWWRVDLQDMYDIKAVTMMNSQDYLCPRDQLNWHYFGSACYYEETTPASWMTAQTNCEAMGGNLVSVTVPAVRDFLKEWVSNPSLDYWIGLNDMTTDGTFQWESYADIPTYTISHLQMTDYSEFVTGFSETPATDDCIHMDGANDLEWDLDNCNVATKRYICQMSLCETDWRLFGTTCYYASSTVATLADARTACQGATLRKGELATVNSTYINSYFSNWLAGNDYWIGLNDISTEDDFVWDASGVQNVVFDYSVNAGAGANGNARSNQFENWEDDDPDTGTADCAILLGTGVNAGQWVNVDCSDSNRYICQRLPTLPEQLETAQIRVGSCGNVAPASTTLEEILLHDQCDDAVSSNEVNQVTAGYWLFRECDANYYGQYVYILKQKVDALVTWFSLCEVEVWGVEIPDAKKQKVGFTQQTVTGLEGELGTMTVTVNKTGGSVDHPTCYRYTLGHTELTAGPTPADYTDDAILDPAFARPDGGQMFLPDDPTEITFTVTVSDDSDVEDDVDEQFQYYIATQSIGLLAGDANGQWPTYETITFTIENDDVTYCWDTPTVSAREDTLIVTAVLTRSGYLDRRSTAYVMTDVDNTAGANQATADTDYDSLPTGTPVVFEVGDTSENVVVTLLQDEDCELSSADDETFKLILEAASEGNLCDTAILTDDYVIVTILHDDAKFYFQEPLFEVKESVGEIVVVVERMGYLDIPSTVGVKTEPLTLTSASTDDYTAFETVITIPTGRTTESVTVVIDDDNLVEDDEETFRLVLVRNPSSLPTCVLDAADDIEADVTIEDDDCFWSVANEEVVLLEQTGPATVTFNCARPDASAVILNRPLTATFKVDSQDAAAEAGVTAATAGDDFTSSTSTSITILAGLTSATANIDITDDMLWEETNEYFDVTLLASEDGQIANPISTRVKIQDNDVEVKIRTCEGDTTVVESGEKFTVTVERIGYLTRSDSVLLYTSAKNASPGTTSGDYENVKAVLTFTAEQRTVEQDIIIHDDDMEEGDESFVVHIEPFGHATYIDPMADMCEITIKDDDCTFSFSIPESNRFVTEADGVTIPVTISRGGHLDRPASIVFSTARITNGAAGHDAEPTTDYVAVSKTLIFQSEESTKTEYVTILDDDEPEVKEYFQVMLSEATCSIDRGDVIAVGIEDNDAVTILMREDSITVDENEGYAHVTVQRTGSLSRIDIVTLRVIPQAVDGTSNAATANSDFKNADITLQFELSEDEKTAQIVVYNDTLEEPSLESFVVRISDVARQSSQGPSALDASIDNDHRETIVYIRDDDGTFQLRSSSRHVSESVGSITVIVDRSGPATDRQIVYLSTTDAEATSPADYQGLAGEALVFEPNIKTVSYTLKIYDDQEPEQTEDFFIYLSTERGNGVGQRVEVVTIEDDDNEIKFVATPGTDATDVSVAVSESVGTARVTVQRSGYGSALPSGQTTVRARSRIVTTNQVDIGSANDSDFTEIDTVLTFQGGQTRQDVLITILDDEVGENLEMFEIYLSDPSPSGNNAVVYPSTMKIYINDDDGGLPDIVDGGDGGDTTDNTGVTNLDTAVIVGIGGGVGLLVLVGILGLIACYSLSRMGSTPAVATNSLPLTAPPRGPPPSYYGSNPRTVQYIHPSGGPRAIRY